MRHGKIDIFYLTFLFENILFNCVARYQDRKQYIIYETYSQTLYGLFQYYPNPFVLPQKTERSTYFFTYYYYFFFFIFSCTIAISKRNYLVS